MVVENVGWHVVKGCLYSEDVTFDVRLTVMRGARMHVVGK